jgi:4-amino-4-deoxy-L-arabinose transferase-like glycosyltransferase
MARKSQPKTTPSKPAQPAEKTSAPLWRRWTTILLLIVVLAAALRLVDLGYAPPGLNQDEAANAWNAWCLLKTGKDQTGTRWPIFYSRCLGENRTTLFFYVMLPFQAIGGLNVWTTRAPSAVGGIFTVLLTYFVGARLFGRTTGLVAAAMLAVNPWHVQQSRWGHEAALCPLLVILPLAMLLWANLPFADEPNRRPRIGLALLGGLMTGVSCYGYPAVRLFLPAFLAAAVLATWRGWWSQLKTRHGATAIAALVVGAAATFGPLAWKHVTDAEQIGKRGKMTQVWTDQDSTRTKIEKILSRYPGHFGPDFLFISGDTYEIQSPAGFGQFHWYMAPLMIIGLTIALRRLRTSRSARVLLVWLVLYPVSDLLSTHFNSSMHALRSSPGVCGLILIGALGAVGAGTWLWQNSRSASIVTACIVAIVVVALNGRFLYHFFGDYNDRPRVYHGYQVDLLKACDWLSPRLKDVDAVFCTTALMNMPYIVTLVGLDYDPRQWFRDVRDVRTTAGQWEIYIRYGKMNFMYGRAWVAALKELQQTGRRHRVLFIVRPGELRLENPVYEIYGPPGTAPLFIYEQNL